MKVSTINPRYKLSSLFSCHSLENFRRSFLTMLFKAILLSVGLLAATEAQGLSAITPPKGKSIDSIPILGLGTFGLQNNEQNTTDAIAGAIQMGYRHFDAAAIYRNERLVGLGIAEGLKRTGLKREDIWVTTKLWDNR
jgi:hypothetical protein